MVYSHPSYVRIIILSLKFKKWAGKLCLLCCNINSEKVTYAWNYKDFFISKLQFTTPKLRGRTWNQKAERLGRPSRPLTALVAFQRANLSMKIFHLDVGFNNAWFFFNFFFVLSCQFLMLVLLFRSNNIPIILTRVPLYNLALIETAC